MNEFDLIHRLTRALPTNESVVVGAGDDCAVLDVGTQDRLLLFKTDAVVEGIHFTRETPAEKIGHKALARCLSDIAAMAGWPTAALITIGLPRKFDVAFVEAIYTGMNALACRHNVAIVGGETTTNPERMLIAVALVGFVPRGKVLRRSGAKAGDAIFVTGELGGSLAGKHLEFEPRLAEARWLAENSDIHAMMDISDGLAGDLRHLLKASGVGAELLKSAIPISRAAKELARSRRHQEADGDSRHEPTPDPSQEGNDASAGRTMLPSLEGSGLGSSEIIHGFKSSVSSHVGGHKTPLVAALTDGEDFELLFTIASKDAVPLLDAWKKQFPRLRLSCIGKIVPGEGITLRDKEGVRPLTAHGYVHFA